MRKVLLSFEWKKICFVRQEIPFPVLILPVIQVFKVPYRKVNIMQLIHFQHADGPQPNAKMGRNHSKNAEEEIQPEEGLRFMPYNCHICCHPLSLPMEHFLLKQSDYEHIR